MRIRWDVSNWNHSGWAEVWHLQRCPESNEDVGGTAVWDLDDDCTQSCGYISNPKLEAKIANRHRWSGRIPIGIDTTCFVILSFFFRFLFREHKSQVLPFRAVVLALKTLLSFACTCQWSPLRPSEEPRKEAQVIGVGQKMSTTGWWWHEADTCQPVPWPSQFFFLDKTTTPRSKDLAEI